MLSDENAFAGRMLVSARWNCSTSPVGARNFEHAPACRSERYRHRCSVAAGRRHKLAHACLRWRNWLASVRHGGRVVRELFDMAALGLPFQAGLHHRTLLDAANFQRRS